MFYIGLDDTDSLAGGCTTHLAIRIIENQIINGEFDLIGFPRLVRLNPNVPWKTRGNGAVALALGKGVGKPILIGEVAGRQLTCYPTADKTRADIRPKELLDSLEGQVEDWAHLDEEKTNPGLVITERTPPPRLYWQRVRGIVAIEENERYLAEGGFRYRGWGNERGLIGALGALAWPAGWVSYELLAYRNQENWGHHRQLDPRGLARLSFEPGTFDSYNPYRDKVVVAPGGPDPILFGLRGTAPPLLVKAAENLAAEPIESWCLWATNQGSDDHIRASDLKTTLKAHGSHRLQGKIKASPSKGPGGHLPFILGDDAGEIQCMAYEPGRPLPAQLERMKTADEVEVFGATQEPPFTLAVEKLRFIYSASEMVKLSNPRCPNCTKAMKSAGAGVGYRCRVCGTSAPEEAAIFIPTQLADDDTAGLGPGWYEPPPGQRRHLARPKVLLENGYWAWERFSWALPSDMSL